MSARILLFPATPGRFTCRVEVREHWTRGGELCHFRVMALDWNGEHLIESFPDPEEAAEFAEGFRLAHRDVFAKDIARRLGDHARRSQVRLWYVEGDHGGAA